MLPKKNRADKKAVEKIFKEGKVISSPSFIFKFILTGNTQTQGFPSLHQKVFSKKAVNRNIERRVGYNALEKYLKYFPLGIIGAFVYKKYTKDLPTIENEIKKILDRIN